jgi:colicin import membrane protein
MPRPPRVRGRSLALAVFAHVLLILALAFGVNWRSDEPATVAAELWSATPQAAAPRAVEPPPTTPPETKPTPKPPAPAPQPNLPDPQIAIEKAKREDAKRAAAEQEQQKQARLEKAEREKEELAQQKAKVEKAKAEKQKADQAKAEQAKNDKAEAARLASIRDQQMKRMAGLAGATGAPSDTGTAERSSAPSASYGGRVAARVKPNIVFTDPIDGNAQAVVQVKLAPDGTIIGKRLVQSSGVKAWDDAVLRAIERTETLPLDNGRAPPAFEIGFRPRD